MSDLCANIDTLLTLHATIMAQLQTPTQNPSPPEVLALERLKASGIPVKPSRKRKRSGGETQSNKNKKKKADKTDKENTPEETDEENTPKLTRQQRDQIADDRIDARLMNPKPVRTPEDEDQVILEMACGFAAPEDPSDWDTILLEAGIHSEQKMTIQTITAIAAAKVPGQPIPLVAAESNILSFVKTTCANTYAAERVLICETMYTQCGWNKLPVATKAVHNRALFIAQNPVLFDKCKTDDEKQKELDAKHTCAHAKFLKNDRDQLTRWRNQVSNLGQVFGLAAVLHPAISIGSLRQRGTLLRVSGRLHVALMKRPELRQEIQARAAANLSVLCGFVQGIVVAEDKESVRKYFAEFPTRHHMYNYY